MSFIPDRTSHRREECLDEITRLVLEFHGSGVDWPGVRAVYPARLAMSCGVSRRLAAPTFSARWARFEQVRAEVAAEARAYLEKFRDWRGAPSGHPGGRPGTGTPG
jgi:hypothetical protein